MSLSVASVTLGTAALGNLFEAMDDAAAERVLAVAWEGGIRSFDTAPHYGLGLSERRLGAFVRTMPRAEFRVSTKVGRLLVPNDERGGDGAAPWDDDLFVVRADTRRVWDFSATGVRASMEQSLARLGLDRIDTLYLHDPDEAPEPDAALHGGLDALAELRAEGLVDDTGIGSKSTPTLVEAARHGGATELMVAGRHTLIDHSATEELLPLCGQHGVRIAAAAVFNSGLLATATPQGPFEYGDASADVLARAQRVADVCRAHGTDLPTAALHYPALDSSVASIVVGARTPDQVRENLERVATPPTPDLWQALRADGLLPVTA